MKNVYYVLLLDSNETTIAHSKSMVILMKVTQE